MKMLVVLFVMEIYIKLELNKYVALKIITLFWDKVAFFAMVILMPVELFAVLQINILDIQFLELLVVYQIVFLIISITLNIVAIAYQIHHATSIIFNLRFAVFNIMCLILVKLVLHFVLI
jgi:hypothetical protein